MNQSVVLLFLSWFEIHLISQMYNHVSFQLDVTEVGTIGVPFAVGPIIAAPTV
jgi:hypothetical protein